MRYQHALRCAARPPGMRCPLLHWRSSSLSAPSAPLTPPLTPHHPPLTNYNGRRSRTLRHTPQSPTAPDYFQSRKPDNYQRTGLASAHVQPLPFLQESQLEDADFSLQRKTVKTVTNEVPSRFSLNLLANETQRLQRARRGPGVGKCLYISHQSQRGHCVGEGVGREMSRWGGGMGEGGGGV